MPATSSTERLPSVVAPSARRTLRLDQWCTVVGCAIGGAADARISRALGLSAMLDVVLAPRVRAYRSLAWPTPCVLGVDDFAFRRRHRYGTILVDLECHRAGRWIRRPTAARSLRATWLEAHPSVEIISRDRGGNHALGARDEGARVGAPHTLPMRSRSQTVSGSILRCGVMLPETVAL